MAILDGLRPFQRWNDGIQIELRLEDWPADVPLPAGSTVVGIGENHETLVYPYWRFVLEPEATIEVVSGWFKVPFLLEEAVEWYKTELTKRGWVRGSERGFVRSDWAVLKFSHPEKKAGVRLSIRRWESLNETTVMMQRGIKYPWSPAEEVSGPHSLSERGLTPNRPHVDDSAPVHSLAEAEEALPREELQVAA